MSNKRQTRPARIGSGGRSAADALNDPALTPNLSHNGAPPLLAAGDDLTSVAAVRCWCREVLAVAWSADRSARGIREPLLYLVAEELEDPDVRPPVVREYRQAIRPTTRHPVTCPAHGRAMVPGAMLIDAARKTSTRLPTGEETPRVGAVVVSRSGRARVQ